MNLSRRQLLRRGALLASAALAGCQRPRRAPGEVALWFSYGGKNRQVLLKLIRRFHREQQQVRVTATFQGDYFEGLIKLRTGMFVGSVPTVTHVVGEVVPYLAQAGALEVMQQLASDISPSLVPALSQRGTFVGAAAQPLVALPFNRSTPVCYFNRALFDQLKLTPPSSWDEMRTVARRATLRQGERTQRYGFECPIDWWFWVALMGQAGGEVITRAGQVALGGRAGEQAIAYWQQLIHQDRSMKRPPGRDYNAWQATNSDFLAGRAAMIWTSTAFLRYLEDNASFPVGCAPLPRKLRYSVPTGGTFFVMPRGVPAAEKHAGQVFLRWMMQPRQANEWATSTGYMPVVQAGLEHLSQQGFFDQHPNFKVTLEQLQHAQPWPWSPQLFRVQREVVQPRLESAVLNRRDARRVMDEARKAAQTP